MCVLTRLHKTSVSYSVPLTFILSNGTVKKVEAKTGSTLMEVGIVNDVGIVGRCECSYSDVPHIFYTKAN